MQITSGFTNTQAHTYMYKSLQCMQDTIMRLVTVDTHTIIKGYIIDLYGGDTI